MIHFASKHDAEETLAHHVEQSHVPRLDFPLVGRLERRRQGNDRRTIVRQLHSGLRRHRVTSLRATNVGDGVSDGDSDDESDDENGDADGDDDHQRKVRTCGVVKSTVIFYKKKK